MTFNLKIRGQKDLFLKVSIYLGAAANTLVHIWVVLIIYSFVWRGYPPYPPFFGSQNPLRKLPSGKNQAGTPTISSPPPKRFVRYLFFSSEMTTSWWFEPWPFWDGEFAWPELKGLLVTSNVRGWKGHFESPGFSLTHFGSNFWPSVQLAMFLIKISCLQLSEYTYISRNFRALLCQNPVFPVAVQMLLQIFSFC